MFRILRDEGDGNSAAPGVTEPAPETKTPEAPAATGGDEPTVAQLTEQITGLKKTIGGQGNEIGEYKAKALLNKQQMDADKAFMTQLKANPAQTLKSLADAAGLKVTTPSAELVTTGDAAVDQTAQINSIVSKALAEHMGPVNTVIGDVQEAHLRSQYGEVWDEMAQVRNSNLIRIQSGTIPMSEVAHKVSEYDRFPEKLAAAKLEGREEYRKELEEKAGQHLPDGTGQEPHKVPESEQNATHAARKLGEQW